MSSLDIVGPGGFFFSEFLTSLVSFRSCHGFDPKALLLLATVS
jgi:hypothetical protein